MKRKNVLLASLSIALLLVSILIYLFPYIKIPNEGTLEVKWASPKGIRFSGLQSDDIIELEYEAEMIISVYLLGVEEANEYRSPSYGHELPEPIYTGTEGSIEIIIERSGDFEVLLWNESISSNIDIEYRILTHTAREKRISLIAGSIFLIMAILITCGLFWSIHRKNGDFR